VAEIVCTTAVCRSRLNSAHRTKPQSPPALLTYVVFDGVSQRKLSKIQLLARSPQNRATERIQNSIEQAVTRGNVEFRTLRVDHRGTVSRATALKRGLDTATRRAARGLAA
jgi:hypothetical protein